MGGVSDYSVQPYKEANRYGLRITHEPTGITIDGNVGMEDRLPQLRAELMAKLEESAKDAPLLPAKAEADPSKLQATVRELRKLVAEYLEVLETEYSQTGMAGERDIARKLARVRAALKE